MSNSERAMWVINFDPERAEDTIKEVRKMKTITPERVSEMSKCGNISRPTYLKPPKKRSHAEFLDETITEIYIFGEWFKTEFDAHSKRQRTRPKQCANELRSLATIFEDLCKREGFVSHAQRFKAGKMFKYRLFYRMSTFESSAQEEVGKASREACNIALAWFLHKRPLEIHEKQLKALPRWPIDKPLPPIPGSGLSLQRHDGESHKVDFSVGRSDSISESDISLEIREKHKSKDAHSALVNYSRLHGGVILVRTHLSEAFDQMWYGHLTFRGQEFFSEELYTTEKKARMAVCGLAFAWGMNGDEKKAVLEEDKKYTVPWLNFPCRPITISTPTLAPKKKRGPAKKKLGVKSCAPPPVKKPQRPGENERYVVSLRPAASDVAINIPGTIQSSQHSPANGYRRLNLQTTEHITLPDRTRVIAIPKPRLMKN